MKKLIIILSTSFCLIASGCYLLKGNDIKNFFGENILNNSELDLINEHITKASETISNFPSDQEQEVIDLDAYNIIKKISKAKIDQYRLKKEYAELSTIEQKNQEINELNLELDEIQSPLKDTIILSSQLNSFINNSNLRESTEKEILLKLNSKVKDKASIAKQRLDRFSRQTSYTELEKSQAKVAAADFELEKDLAEIELDVLTRSRNGDINAALWGMKQEIVAREENLNQHEKSILEQKEFFKRKLAPRTKAMLEAILNSDDIASVDYEQILIAQTELSEMGEQEIDPFD